MPKLTEAMIQRRIAKLQLIAKKLISQKLELRVGRTQYEKQPEKERPSAID